MSGPAALAELPTLEDDRARRNLEFLPIETGRLGNESPVEEIPDMPTVGYREEERRMNKGIDSAPGRNRTSARGLGNRCSIH